MIALSGELHKSFLLIFRGGDCKNLVAFFVHIVTNLYGIFGIFGIYVESDFSAPPQRADVFSAARVFTEPAGHVIFPEYADLSLTLSHFTL